jgi:hypothetical protein
MLDTPDLVLLRQTLEKYIVALATEQHPDDDWPYTVYEAALRAFYGPDVMEQLFA